MKVDMQPQDPAQLQQLERNEGYLIGDPGNLALLGAVVDLCLAAGQPQRAESHVRSALEQQADDPYLQAMLGNTLLAQQQWAAAADVFGQLLASHKDAGLAYNFGLACLWLGRWQEGWQALAPYVQAEAANPGPAAVTLALRLLHRLGDLAAARDLLQRYRDAMGQAPAFLGAASAVCLDDGDLEQAEALSVASLANGRNVEALVVAGSVALARTDSIAAVPLFEEALAVNHNEARAWAGLGMASMLRQDLAAAQGQLEKAVHFMPGHIGTWHLLGWARLYRGDLVGATTAFNTALELDRNFGESHGGMAVVQAMAGLGPGPRQPVGSLCPDGTERRPAGPGALPGSGHAPAGQPPGHVWPQHGRNRALPPGQLTMGSDTALQMIAELLWNGLLIAAPLLAVTLVVGLVISIVQVVTQVQEASLTFIPKIIAAVVVMVVCGPWMLKRLVGYSTGLIASIPQYF
jgi:flagellar biosynthetic protein FliQ